MRGTNWLWFGLAALGGAAAALGGGCSPKEGRALPNQPPVVKLTGGPIEGGTVSYRIRFDWSANDPDGRVDHFEVAVDPPAAFTEDEIARGGQGISEMDIPGTGGEPDTTRVTKEGGASFDWIHTVDFNETLEFATPNPDSEMVGSLKRPLGRFSGLHAVYVRAVDGEGLAGDPAHVAFNATTVAPRATLRSPDLSGGTDLFTLGDTLHVRADGVDPDGSTGLPVGYEVRLLDLSTLGPIPVIQIDTPQLLFSGGDSAWTYVPGPELKLDLPLRAGRGYLFGVRAVDEAGAVEPFLTFGRNAVKFASTAGGGIPRITVAAAEIPTVTSSGAVTTRDFNLPSGITLHLNVSCSAEDYGGACDALRWGLNLADPENGPGFSAWTTNFALPPITLEAIGIQTVSVQVRDTYGTVAAVVLVLNPVDVPMDRPALLVDDNYNATYPRDSENDAFWKSLFDDSGRFPANQYFAYETYGPDDRLSQTPAPPSLAEMGRYRLQIWDVAGAASGGGAGLYQAASVNRQLDAYLGAGGQAWISGTYTVPTMLPEVPGGSYVNLNYPLSVSPGSFAWQYLKLYTDDVRNDKEANQNNNLVAVNPFPYPVGDYRRNQPPVYPAMRIDTTKVSPFRHGIPFCDAIFGLIDASAHLSDGFRGVLDSLYVSAAYGPTIGRSSPYEGRLDALRWHNPDPARTQGAVQWFGFPMYYFEKTGAQTVFNRSIDWFREETGP